MFRNCFDYGAYATGCSPNFGSSDSSGYCTFKIPSWSGSDTSFAMYTSNNLSAENNCWSLQNSVLVDTTSIDFWIRGSGTVDVNPFLVMEPPENYGEQQKRSSRVDVLPARFELLQNYPNPFNPACLIEYSLSQKDEVKLTIFNILGQQIVSLVDQEQSSGHYRVMWDGRDANGHPCASGIYFYKLTAGEFVSAKKMVMLK